VTETEFSYEIIAKKELAEYNFGICRLDTLPDDLTKPGEGACTQDLDGLGLG
jgi:hypothetical protein